jgi:hypothetical protein
MNSFEIVERCQGVTHRKLDYWCNRGVFGPNHDQPGSGIRRSFSDQDLVVAKVLGYVSVAFDEWSRRAGGYIAVYSVIADQIREGKAVAVIEMRTGMVLEVNIQQILAESP